jgi:hypothetical protein
MAQRQSPKTNESKVLDDLTKEVAAVEAKLTGLEQKCNAAGNSAVAGKRPFFAVYSKAAFAAMAVLFLLACVAAVVFAILYAKTTKR